MTPVPPDLDDIDNLLGEVFEAPPTQWQEQIETRCRTHPQHATVLRRRFELLCAVGFDREPGADASVAPAVPDRLGEFRLLRRLGSGGMGVVFAAEQESLGREVALKVVRPELMFAEGARERFRREVDAIARLDHPAIVPVLTHGEEKGALFYVMPLVRGCSGDEVIRRLAGREPARLSGADLQRAITVADEPVGDIFAGRYWQACVRLVRQAALGLHHAHGRGLVHRDVKPSNLLFTGEGRTLVLDFGLAYAREDARITRTGSAPGSPAYMAPEQMRGNITDARSDVYSLAATLHHLLTLRCPFPIEDSEVLRARVLAGRPESLDGAGIPFELGVVLGAAMDLDPARRHPSTQAFADDLDAVLAQRPVQARRLPLRLRAQRWVQRHPALTTGLVLGALLSIGTPTAIAVGIAGQRDRARAAERLAQRTTYVANIAAASAALQVGDAAEAQRRLDACPDELRGFEWRHLHMALDGSLRTFAGHATSVIAVAITDGGDLMASGDRAGRLLLWRPLLDATSREVKLPCTEAVTSLTFSADERILIVLQRKEYPDLSLSSSAHVTVVACEGGDVIAERGAEFDERVCVVSDGTAVLIVRRDFTVDELDGVTLDVRHVHQLAREGTVAVPVMASDGEWLFAPYGDAVQVWRLADGAAEILPGVFDSGVVDAAAVPGKVAMVTSEGSVCVAECAPLRVRTLDHSSPRVRRVALDRRGERVVGVGEGTAVRTWETALGRRLGTVHGTMSFASAVAVATRRPLIVAGGNNATPQLFGACGGTDRQELLGHAGNVGSLATISSGELVSGSQEATVRSWQPRSGRPMVTSDYSGHWVNALAESSDGRHVYAAHQEKISRLRLSDMAVVDEYNTDLGWITNMATLPDGRLLLTITTDHSTGEAALAIVDYPRRIALQRLEAGKGSSSWSLALSPDGRHAFLGGETNITGWSVGERLAPAETLPAKSRVFALRCARDGRTLFATERYDLVARAIPGGAERWRKKCSQPVSCLFELNDGTRLVCGHVDGSVSLWDPSDGTRMVTLPTSKTMILALTGDSHGRWLAAAGEGGSALTLFRAEADVNFDERLERATTAFAMGLDQNLRRELHVRDDVIAAIAQQTHLDQRVRELATHFEQLRPRCTWESSARSLEVALVPGLPRTRYERVLRVAEYILGISPTDSQALAAGVLACLRLDRTEAVLHMLERFAGGDGMRPTTLSLCRVIALARRGRVREAAAALDEIEQGLARTPAKEDHVSLLHEARRAVGR